MAYAATRKSNRNRKVAFKMSEYQTKSKSRKGKKGKVEFHTGEPCEVCSEDRGKTLECVACGLYFHCSCIELEEEDITDTDTFTCPNCDPVDGDGPPEEKERKEMANEIKKQDITYMLKHPEEASLRYRVEESEEKKAKKKNKEAEVESEEDMETEGQEKDEKSGDKDMEENDENKEENGEKNDANKEENEENNKDENGEKSEKEDKEKPEMKTDKKKQQKQKEKSQFDPDTYLSVNNSVYLRDFEAKTHPQREEILQKYQQELQDLMENALLFHAGYHNPKGISFGISVLNNLGKVFTQFLAWQRLMQMIENLSEPPVKKDDNCSRHNKRGLIESQISSQQGGMQKKYKYRPPETELNVQITGPVSKFNFVESDKSSALMKLQRQNQNGPQSSNPNNNVPVGPSPFSGYPANPLFPNEKARAKSGGWPGAGGSNPSNFPNNNMYNQGGGNPNSRQPWSNTNSGNYMQMDKKKMADKPFAWKNVQDASEGLEQNQRAQNVPRVILAAGLRGKNRSDQEINIKFTLPLVSPFLIGRKNSKCDLDLYTHTEVKTISHQHCGIAFIEETNQFEIQNFGRNGTRVNGSTVLKKIDDSENLSPTTPRGQAVLRNGDVIEIGKIALTFFVEHGAPLQQPPPVNKLSPVSNKPPPTQLPNSPTPTQSPTNMSTGIRVGPDGQLMQAPNGVPIPDLKKIFPGLKHVLNSSSMNQMNSVINNTVINNTTNPNTNLSNSNPNTLNPLKRMMPQSVLGPNAHPYSLQQQQSQLHLLQQQQQHQQQQQQQHFAQSQHFNSMGKFPYPQTQSSLGSAYNPYHKVPTQPYGMKYSSLPGGQMPSMQNRFPQTYSERPYIPQNPLPSQLSNLSHLPQSLSSLPGTSPLGLSSPSSAQLPPLSNSSSSPAGSTPLPQSIIQSLPQSVSSSLLQLPPMTTPNGTSTGQGSPQSTPPSTSTTSTFNSSPKQQ